ncbi:hypothetical protein FLONG3_2597 [Fusarium longipes]|uniref:F-box domain-containing protein n=1 Tax=Fusarium longipes TaxID=694270 RepID=A0A395T3J7_9HYPO|nr:hypothetical protein FLONG3_2597 [Fusarium longipes]
MIPSEYKTEEVAAPRTSLELLPAKILTQILEGLSTLAALWNLLRASPKSRHLFNKDPVTWTDLILSGPNTTTPRRIQELIRTVALARADKLPFSFSDCVKQFLHHNVCGCGTIETLGTLPLPKEPHVLRSLLATDHRISTLPKSFLASLLKGLRYSDIAIHQLNPWYRQPFENAIAPNKPPQDEELEEIRAVHAEWAMQLMEELHFLTIKHPEITQCLKVCT